MQPRRVGPYEVVRTLGSGAAGVVYEVRDPGVPRRLALKLVRRSAIESHEMARFLREAEYLARLDHPNVIKVHSVGMAPEGPYLLEDLLDGQDLARAQGHRPLEPRRAAAIVAALAAGVEAAHAAGILHRDLKPANVFLCADDRPVLLDFGLARDQDAETLTRTGAMIGTPVYMAPEQVRGLPGRALDERVDVYGLGAILYTLLTGNAPFAGDTVVQVLLQILREEPVWPARCAPGVPAELDAVCRRAMAKPPDARHASARDLRLELERFLRGEREAARAPARWPLALGLASLVVALGAGLVVALSRRPPPDRPAAPAERPPVAPRSGPPGGAGQPAPLLRLRAGDAWRSVYDYEETDGLFRCRIVFHLSQAVESADDQRARIVGRIDRVQGGFGSGGDLDPAGAPSLFDSQRPEPGHPLSQLGVAAGAVVRFELALRTGRLSALSGMDGVSGAIRASPAPEAAAILDAGAATLGGFYAAALSDAACTRTFGGLLEHGREDVPWRVAPGAAGGRARSWLQSPRDGLACLLPPVYSRLVVRPEHRFSVRGEATFADGRLEGATVSQEWLGTAQEGHLVPRGDHDPRSLVRWSCTLVR